MPDLRAASDRQAALFSTVDSVRHGNSEIRCLHHASLAHEFNDCGNRRCLERGVTVSDDIRHLEMHLIQIAVVEWEHFGYSHIYPLPSYMPQLQGRGNCISHLQDVSVMIGSPVLMVVAVATGGCRRVPDNGETTVSTPYLCLQSSPVGAGFVQ